MMSYDVIVCINDVILMYYDLILQLLALGRLRTSIASELSNNRLLNIPSDVYELLWVTDFPLFSIVDDSETGQLTDL